MCSRCDKAGARGAGRGACVHPRLARLAATWRSEAGSPRAPRPSPRLFAAAIVLAATLAACSREQPAARDVALSSERALVLTSDLQAGAPLRVATRNPLEGDQRALAEGERLYLWMNCAGCHGPNGGGGMGPPFRDADWIYGRDPASLHQSIRQGRPNGMPAFGGRLPDAQIWQIVLYVEQLADEGAKKAASQGSR